MNELTYCVKYTPTNGFRTRTRKFACKDGYVHVRLRKYGDKVETIRGFKNKFAFLITYLVATFAKNKYRIPADEDSQFKRSRLASDCTTAIDDVYHTFYHRLMHDEFEMYSLDKRLYGIKISTRYTKTKCGLRESMIGDVANMELMNEHDSFHGFDDAIDWFLVRYKISCLSDFLFDDCYELRIERRNNEDDTDDSIW